MRHAKAPSLSVILTALKRLIKDIFSPISLGIFLYSFLPLIGVIYNYYDFYTLFFVYLLETIILGVLSIIKIFYLNWRELYIYVPVNILLIGGISLFSLIIVVTTSSETRIPLSQMLFHYPLKSPYLVIANLLYFLVQEIYFMIRSIRSGTIKLVNDFLKSNLIKSNKDLIFNILLNQINIGLIRISVIFLAGFFAMFAIVPAFFVYVLFYNYIGPANLGVVLFLYPIMFGICLFKGMFDVLMHISEKYDSETISELNLKLKTVT